MAHFLFRYAFAWQTRTAKGLPLSGSPLSLTDLPSVLKDQIIHITHRLFRLHTLPSFAISAFATYSVYAAEGEKLHETVHGTVHFFAPPWRPAFTNGEKMCIIYLIMCKCEENDHGTDTRRPV